MYKSWFSVDSLFWKTARTAEEKNYVRRWTMEHFRLAVGYLNHAGLTPVQIQLFLRKPFSKFDGHDYMTVLLLSLAITKKTTTVERLHQHLQELEYWARMHGYSICIKTEELQEVGTINAYLGLTGAAD